MEKNIPWNTGGGNIKISFTGNGNEDIAIESDTPNESFEKRIQVITLRTTKGTSIQTKSLTVMQAPKTIPVGTVYNYDYTGDVQQVILPKGKYKLQCWGAQGGSVSGSYSAVGSKGGYSEGIITLTETTTLYIFVGGKGRDISTSNTSGTENGGWNGGGGASRKASYNSGNTYGESFPRAGGGATDIALVASDMSYNNYRNNRSNASLLSRCIVAGGGAGASARYTEITTTTTTTETITENVMSGNWSGGRYYDNVSAYQITTSSFLGEVGRSYSIRTTGNASRAYLVYSSNTSKLYEGEKLTTATSLMGVIRHLNEDDSGTYSIDGTYEKTISTETKDTSHGTSNANQQGGGTSGNGQYPGTQSAAGNSGDFGLGANQTTTNYRYVAGAGGGGWYGGGTYRSDTSTSYVNYSGGGSGFVNIAANAPYRPNGYTGLQLDSGMTVAGNSSFESPSGGTETGHSGNGYARITVLEQ